LKMCDCGENCACGDNCKCGEPTHKKAKTKETDHHTSFPSKLECAVIYADDVLKTAQYYKDVFGFSFTASPEFPEWIELSPPQKDGTRIGVHKSGKREAGEATGSVSLSFCVKDLNKFHEAVSRRTDVTVVAKPEKQPWGGVLADYKTIDGVHFSVVQEYDFTSTTTKGETKKEEKAEKPGNGVCHLDIPVGNMDRAKKFYGDVFSWTFNQWKPEYALFQSHDKDYSVGGGLFSDDSKESTKQRITFPLLHLNVPSVDSFVEKVKHHGGTIVKDTYLIGEGIGYNAFFKDSEGNVMGLYSKAK